MALSALLHPWVSLRTAYTYPDYRYHDFDKVEPGEIVDLDGNRQPNVPEHTFGGELRLDHPSGLFASLSLYYFSDLEVNDENDAESDGAMTSEFRTGYEWRRGRVVLSPFAGVRNWTGVEYNGTIRPNAAFDRYFEPAAEAELYAGVEVRY